MKKIISTQDLKARIGEVMDAVRLRGDRYVITRRGKPVAALVPLYINASYERNRERLFKVIDEVHKQNEGIPPEKIQAAIDQAIDEVRR